MVALSKLLYQAKNHENIMQLLFTIGVDINLIDGYYICTFQSTSGKGYENMVRLLLAKGTDINLTSEINNCALQSISANDYENIA